VTAADFLPDGKHLFIISADGDGALHVLQYDPEHPKSERGTKLLHRSVFHTGSYLTTMTLLPRTLGSTGLADLGSSDSMEIGSDSARQQVLVTTQEGGLALITPLSESTYRRLSALQNLLITNTEQACGLNPRAYRAVETDGIGGRAVIDGDMVRKWLDQSTQHKSSLADKAGGTVWEVKGDLESISGGGLGFLE
jgi:cleavage and polyadenylation specificity factor subunit 1